MNLRSGRLKGKMSDEAASFTSSLEFDKRIFEADIKLNTAHTTMLAKKGIIPSEIADKILKALNELKNEGIGALDLDPSVEDIHMAVENYVTSKIGEVAGFMHTAKSRNDQVATDLRLVLKEEIKGIGFNILKFIEEILDMASEHKETIFVGYTHLQHAQPTTFAHYLLAYANALRRDYERLMDAYKRVDMNPLGSAALTTTSFPIDREMTTELLGFSRIMENSIDGVSSRDFIAETVFSLSMLASTMSKICEELILWSTFEFGVVEISYAYSSTSSIMPQKKNPDVAEIARGKSAILTGELMTILTILKALPYSYNRDLQEITPHLWNSVDNAKEMMNMVRGMLTTIEINKERTAELAKSNFATATELADILVREKNMPFRTAHKIVGRMVTEALENKVSLDDIDSNFLDNVAHEVMGKSLDLNDELIRKALDPYENVKARTVIGGSSPEAVEKVIVSLRTFLNEEI
ncbi:argininosuccinate lyase [Methanobacterium bryantii]|uniref:Argininosuccinate lyase n=1 Tax=Methanobacterium bryantii TaxID=2161 RepID=A0A2A2H2G7_METBR|nr:argininosuccinate lyase [Methanobacterium bryantii]PAV03504.1 argininosuccinate lyase [Methanobacterium bryantii]